MYRKEDVLDIPVSRVAQKLGIQLTKSGNYYKGKCPFHDDEKESFAVYDNLKDDGPGIWKCFTEGIYGDSIELVMMYKRIAFSSSLSWIGRNFGLKRQPVSEEERLAMYQRSIATPVLNVAAEWFYERAGHREYKYLTEERGISNTSIKEFMIGYAPKEKYRLKKFLYNEGFSDEALVVSGLFGEGEGGIYPLFYDRIMIPHRNVSGNVVGFSGRAISESEDIKYITKNAPYAKKGKYVYGLFEGKEHDAKRVFVVEGIFDVISLRQELGETGVAVLGAAPAKTHVKLIESSLHPEQVYIALDGDEAGKKGTVRFIKNIYDEDFKYDAVSDFYVFPTPEGKDVDLIVRESPEKIEELVSESLSIVEYIIRHYAYHTDFSKVGSVGNFISKSFEIISSVGNFSEYEYLEILSEISDVPLEKLEKKYNVVKANQLQYAFEEYEKPLIKYLIRKDNKSDKLEKYLGVSLDSLLSDKAKRILEGDFSEYSTKIFFMSIKEMENVSDFDEALYHARLLLSVKLYRIIQEYRSLGKESRKIINEKTDTKIKEINILYRKNLRKIMREIS